jgi:hypothetical protein
VRDLRPEVSTNLADAIDRALAYQADARPANIRTRMLLYGGASAIPLERRRSLAWRHRLSTAARRGWGDRPAHRRRRRHKHRAIALWRSSRSWPVGLLARPMSITTRSCSSGSRVKSFVDSLPWKVEERLSVAETIRSISSAR